jgi:hypothetical protein
MYKRARKMRGEFINPLISSPMADPGCALNASGALKSADDIEWYNDADDDAPMETVSITAPRRLAASSSTSSLSQGNLDGFVRLTSSGKVPADFVAGSRRSGRASKPSAKVREAASTSSIPTKRPAPSMATSARKRVSVDTELAPEVDPSSDMFEDGGDDDDEMPELQECSDDEDEDERVHEEYEKNKAMADADRDVSRLFLLLAKIVTYYVLY